MRIENVTAKRATAKALLVEIDGETYWVPQVAIHDDSEVFDAAENSKGDLVVAEWWARKEGLA